MSESIPKLDTVDTYRYHDDSEMGVIIKFDDGFEAGTIKANTQVIIQRGLDHELDGWLDIEVYAADDYASPVRTINLAHPNDPMGPYEAAVRKVLEYVTQYDSRRNLRQSGIVGEALSDAFDRTEKNAERHRRQEV